MLRRILAAKIIITIVLWAAPALLLPATSFPLFGIPEPPLSHLVFIRLLGAAYVALVAGYALAWRSPTRHASAIVVGIVSNGLAAIVIVSVGASGGYASWNALGSLYIWTSAMLTAALAVGLAVTARPLLKKIAADRGERPRSMKVV